MASPKDDQYKRVARWLSAELSRNETLTPANLNLVAKAFHYLPPPANFDMTKMLHESRLGVQVNTLLRRFKDQIVANTAVEIELESRKSIEELWLATNSLRYCLTPSTLRLFKSIAATVGVDGEIAAAIDEEVEVAIRPRDGLKAEVLKSIEFGDVNGVLHILENERLISQDWADIASAAGRVRAKEVANELLTALWGCRKGSGDQLDNFAYGVFAEAAGRSRNGELLTEIWNEVDIRRGKLPNRTVGFFLSAAAQTKNGRVFREVLASWRVSEKDFLVNDHGVWGSVFSAAVALNDEESIRQIWSKFKRFWDPIKFRGAGTLGQNLRNFVVPNLSDKELGADIVETLDGVRVDFDKCFQIFETCLPKDPRFGGAGRTLMKWLINSYFKCPQNEFDGRVGRFIIRIFALPKDKQILAWESTLSRGQEAYSGCINARWRLRVQSISDEVDGIAESDFKDRIVDGSVTEMLRSLQLSADAIVEPPQPHVTNLSTVAGSLIDYLIDNQVDFLRSPRMTTPEAKIIFFNGVSEKLDEVQAVSFSTGQWEAFLRQLLQQMLKRVGTDIFVEPIAARFHGVKSEFETRFEMPLRNSVLCEDETQQLLEHARFYIRNVVRGRTFIRTGPSKSVSIASNVRKILVWNGPQVTVTQVDIPDAFYADLWDGAKADVLNPMLGEIADNAFRSLERVDDEKTFYQVSLSEGHGENAGFGMLIVENSMPEQDGPGRYSTGQGKKFIQESAFRMGGDAMFRITETEFGKIFRWEIRLPLPRS